MVVGLGNPGPDYRDTRHNAGFWFVEKWAGTLGLSFRKAWFRPYFFAVHEVAGDRLVLVKPLTFMNLSGQILPALLERFGAGPQDLAVVFDQMDLPPGRVRMKPKGSHAGHNGLRSIEASLGSPDYHRLALGIGRPAPGESIVDHVLGTPSPEDRASVEAALERTVALADRFWSQGWEPWIHAVNQRDLVPS